MAENGKTLVTKKVICKHLEISARTFDQLADPELPHEDRLPAYRFSANSSWRMDLHDYEAWKARRKEFV